MRRLKPKFEGPVLVAACLLLASLPCFAEVGTIVYTGPKSELAVNPVASEKNFYQTYFSNLDKQISREYHDQWSYHESQIRYAATEWNHEYLALGTLNHYGRAPYEGDIRNAFAARVFRLRTDEAIRTYLSHAAKKREVRQAARAVENVKETKISFHSPGANGASSSPREFRFGYDLYSDIAKLECLFGRLQAGLYHERAVGSRISNAPESASTTSVRLLASLGDSLPSTSVGYVPSTKSLSASITQTINRNITGQFFSSKVLDGSSTLPYYEVRMTYTISF